MPYELHPIGTRDQLRQTFDRVAQQYDENRPSYPPAVFDDVLLISDVTPESRLLEIGCGTGHATQVFAARGLRIHALEMGENMADLARRRLVAFPHVAIEVADFDHWTTPDRYHLAYAATSYHWLNPATREQQIASLLHSRGWFATWRNRHIRNGSSDAFIDEAHVIYSTVAPKLVLGSRPTPRLSRGRRSRTRGIQPPASTMSPSYASTTGARPTPPASTSRCSTRTLTTSSLARRAPLSPLRPIVRAHRPRVIAAPSSRTTPPYCKMATPAPVSLTPYPLFADPCPHHCFTIHS